MTSRLPGTDTAAAAEARRPLALIVDDIEQNRRLARDVLRASGLATIEAQSGNEAIALAGECLPDVILMDLRLPDMDGTVVAKLLRAEARTAPIPVVALTSLPLEGGCEWLQAAGFAGWLEKPIDVAAFPAQVRGYCEIASGSLEA